MPGSRLSGNFLRGKGLKVGDIDICNIDIWEFNEAFASQSLACVRDLGIARMAPFYEGGPIR
ncbi:MAG: hypothetical protein WAN57_04645 [Smithella sp.]